MNFAININVKPENPILKENNQTQLKEQENKDKPIFSNKEEYRELKNDVRDQYRSAKDELSEKKDSLSKEEYRSLKDKIKNAYRQFKDFMRAKKKELRNADKLDKNDVADVKNEVKDNAVDKTADTVNTNNTITADTKVPVKTEANTAQNNTAVVKDNPETSTVESKQPEATVTQDNTAVVKDAPNTSPAPTVESKPPEILPEEPKEPTIIDKLKTLLTGEASQNTALPEPVANKPVINTQPPVGDNQAEQAVTSKPSVVQSNANGEYTVKDGKVYGPDGKEFVAKGFNVGGDKYWTEHDESQDTGKLKSWGVNTVRLENRVKVAGNTWRDQNQKIGNFKEYVEKFTDAGMVVVLDARDTTGKILNDKEQNEVASWYKDKAQMFKDNDKVWFDTGNEPNGSDAQWLSYQSKIIDSIKGTGNDNPILVDENGWGQGNGGQNSSILNVGDQLNNKYDNLIFSPHVYNTFDNQKLDTYLDKMQDKGMAVILGEYGNKQADIVHKQAGDHNIGALAWSWDGTADNNGDFHLTNGGNGWDINNDKNPGNLSEFGKKVWNFHH